MMPAQLNVSASTTWGILFFIGGVLPRPLQVWQGESYRHDCKQEFDPALMAAKFHVRKRDHARHQGLA
jgi:hypothetical protein